MLPFRTEAIADSLRANAFEYKDFFYVYINTRKKSEGQLLPLPVRHNKYGFVNS